MPVRRAVVEGDLPPRVLAVLGAGGARAAEPAEPAEPAARPLTGQLISGGWVPDPWPRDPGRSRGRSQGRAPAGRNGQGRHRRVRPPVVSVPASLQAVRARPRLAAVVGVLLLVLAVAAVLGIRVASAVASSQPQPVAVAEPAGLTQRSVPAAFVTSAAVRDAPAPAAPGTPGPGTPGPGTPGPGTAAAGHGGASAAGLPAVLVVHVVGQVRRPGVVRLPDGARVQDALRTAGGATRDADLSRLNLARRVADGEQVVVPRPGDPVSPGPAPGAPGAGGTGGLGGSPATSSGAAGGAPVNLNTADLAALDTLPGVGPVLAQRILDWRAANGRFTTVEELNEVSGIGEKLLAQLAARVSV